MLFGVILEYFFLYFWCLCIDINLYNKKYVDVDVYLIFFFKVNFLIMRKILNFEGFLYICCKISKYVIVLKM